MLWQRRSVAHIDGRNAMKAVRRTGALNDFDLLEPEVIENLLNAVKSARQEQHFVGCDAENKSKQAVAVVRYDTDDGAFIAKAGGTNVGPFFDQCPFWLWRRQ